MRSNGEARAWFRPAAGEADRAALRLAWAYVAFRLAHTAVHLTSNNVMHRLAAFGLSMAVLAAMWVWLVARVF